MSPYDAEDYQRVATVNNFNAFPSIVKCDEWLNCQDCKVLLVYLFPQWCRWNNKNILHTEYYPITFLIYLRIFSTLYLAVSSLALIPLFAHSICPRNLIRNIPDKGKVWNALQCIAAFRSGKVTSTAQCSWTLSHPYNCPYKCYHSYSHRYCYGFFYYL